MMRIGQFIKVLVLSVLVFTGCTPLQSSQTPGTTPLVTSVPATTTPTPSKQITATPAGLKSSPTPMPTGQTPATNGWQQYHNPNWGIKIAYPPDWSAQVNNGEVIFKSTSGETIRLDHIQAGDLSTQDFLNQNQLPNTRCINGENAGNVQYRSCFDTIAFSTTAYLVITPSQGSPQFFTLSTFERGDLNIFNAMLASIRVS